MFSQKFCRFFFLLIANVMLSSAVVADSDVSNLENPKWDAKKVPPMDEPPLVKGATERWKEAGKISPTKTCQDHEALKLLPDSQIIVTATKEKNVAVTGNFTRFAGYIYSLKKDITVESGEGRVDLTSFDSKVPARDRRVQRYVLGADSPESAITDVKLGFGKGLKLPSMAGGKNTGELDVSFSLGTKTHRLNFPIVIEQLPDKTFLLSSQRDGSFTYVTDANRASVMQLLELCNHHFLANYVAVGVKWHLARTCR